MRDWKKMVWTLGVAAALAVGCGSAESRAVPEDQASTGHEAVPRAESPEATTVVCHLDCSGTEASASGATEEEARAAVSRYISQNCRPEDGEYFIFCDPPR